MSNDKILQSNL